MREGIFFLLFLQSRICHWQDQFKIEQKLQCYSICETAFAETNWISTKQMPLALSTYKRALYMYKFLYIYKLTQFVLYACMGYISDASIELAWKLWASMPPSSHHSLGVFDAFDCFCRAWIDEIIYIVIRRLYADTLDMFAFFFLIFNHVLSAVLLSLNLSVKWWSFNL